MKQNNLLFVFIALLIIIGAIFVFIKNFNNQRFAQKVTPKTQNQPIEGNIIGLLQSGKTQQCNFSVEEQGVKTVGVVYIQKGDIRADLTMIKNGQESDIGLIRQKDLTYIWGSVLPKNTGLKLNLTPSEFSSSINKYFDPTKQTSYNCIPNLPDSSLFTPPGDINFIETKIP